MARFGTAEAVPFPAWTKQGLRLQARLRRSREILPAALPGFSMFPYNRECGGVAQVARATVS